MNWILFGFKGCGKTYFGSRLGLPFLDTDTMIEEKVGLSPREIVLKGGEKTFRKYEKEVVLALHCTKTVIAVGGGTVLDKENQIFLQKLGTFIYLDCPKDILQRRVLSPPLPTFLDPSDPRKSFEKMYSTRKPIYETIPSIRIQLKGKTEQEVIDNLWQAINLDKSSASLLGESPTARQSEL